MLAGGVVVAAGVEKTGGENSRYLVKSDNGILKMVFGVNHKFDSGFTTELSKGQLKFLNRLGVETEEVAIYTIMAKPTCNDNEICELGENPSCADCKNIAEDPDPDPTECSPTDAMPWGIERVNGGTGGTGIIIAVLDTGVDTDHPDLKGNIGDCQTFVDRTTTCEDDNGHGTHVAGTIAANGKIMGVAPGAKIMAIKVLNKRGRGYTDDIAAGIEYAADNGADIISMSLGGSSESSLIKDAIEDAVSKGVLVIASAGNSGPTEGSIGYPAANPGVVAVAAFDSSDNIADFSSRGSILNVGDWVIQDREIEFAAPGVYVESTYNDGCYAIMRGTSMAAPHISGIAARDWQVDGATATRIYLQGLAKTYTLDNIDYGLTGDDTEAGFGLPIVLPVVPTS